MWRDVSLHDWLLSMTGEAKGDDIFPFFQSDEGIMPGPHP